MWASQPRFRLNKSWHELTDGCCRLKVLKIYPSQNFFENILKQAFYSAPAAARCHITVLHHNIVLQCYITVLYNKAELQGFKMYLNQHLNTKKRRY